MENSWIGSSDSWDLQVEGNRIVVRQRKGVYSLILRIEVDGRLVIERLDMKLGDAHLLISEATHALGRYDQFGRIYWFHASTQSIAVPLVNAAAIEFCDPAEIERRDQYWNGRGQRLADAAGHMVIQTGLGVTFKPYGILVASNCLSFGMAEVSLGGPRPLHKMRKVVFGRPSSVPIFIATGELE